jgi:L-gulonate 3-dehydrogenase
MEPEPESQFDDGHIAVVGAGLVGSGWAIVFARAGLTVRLFDSAPSASERALQWISDRLDDLRDAGLIEDPHPVFARITIADTLSDSVIGSTYIQESVLERVDVKKALMSQIDALIGPKTLVGSSSSGLPASLYTEHVACRGRCLVAHPVNPPYLAPIVELVPAPWTTEAAMGLVRSLMERVGQSPVQLSREIEGFVLNRLQGVLLMEAWRLVEDGIVSAEDLDKTVSQGLGLRWSFMGPFETIDLNAPGGVADYAARLGGLYHSIAESTVEHRRWSPELISMVAAQRRASLPFEELASRGEWRDRRLMALARHKKEMERFDDGSASKADGRNK